MPESDLGTPSILTEVLNQKRIEDIEADIKRILKKLKKIKKRGRWQHGEG